MLLKIAHICFCGDIGTALIFLQNVGYKKKFFDSEVVPMEITQKLLSKRLINFKMYFLESHGNFSIELLEFNHYSSNIGLIQPIFSGKIFDLNYVNKKYSIILNGKKYHQNKLLGSSVFIDLDRHKNNFSFNSIFLKTRNLDISIAFWEFIGFKCVKKLESQACLEFKCIFTRNIFYMYLNSYVDIEMEAENIDSSGFHVLGFFSGSIFYEQKKIHEAGYEVTEIEQIELNNNKMDIFYTRSPEGLIVEILSMKTI